MKNIKENTENFICKKIEKLIYEKGLNNSNAVDIIDKNSSQEAKSMCTITLERMNEILSVGAREDESGRYGLSCGIK